jgi:hypothetical protein
LSPFLKQSPTEHLQASVQFAGDQKFLIVGPKKKESSISWVLKRTKDSNDNE